MSCSQMLCRTNRYLARLKTISFQRINNRSFSVLTSKRQNLIVALPSLSKQVIANHPKRSCLTQANANDHDFEKACVETLESLTDYFEDLVENSEHLKSADVSYSDGVLTVNFGQPYGSYVINRQSPNRQIWLSSPTTGPKRYDFVASGCGYWIYKHDGVTMHELLQNEIKQIVKKEVDFFNLVYGRR